MLGCKGLVFGTERQSVGKGGCASRSGRKRPGGLQGWAPQGKALEAEVELEIK